MRLSGFCLVFVTAVTLTSGCIDEQPPADASSPAGVPHYLLERNGQEIPLWISVQTADQEVTLTIETGFRTEQFVADGETHAVLFQVTPKRDAVWTSFATWPQQIVPAGTAAHGTSDGSGAARLLLPWVSVSPQAGWTTDGEVWTFTADCRGWCDGPAPAQTWTVQGLVGPWPATMELWSEGIMQAKWTRLAMPDYADEATGHVEPPSVVAACDGMPCDGDQTVRQSVTRATAIAESSLAAQQVGGVQARCYVTLMQGESSQAFAFDAIASDGTRYTFNGYVAADVLAEDTAVVVPEASQRVTSCLGKAVMSAKPLRDLIGPFEDFCREPVDYADYSYGATGPVGPMRATMAKWFVVGTQQCFMSFLADTGEPEIGIRPTPR